MNDCLFDCNFCRSGKLLGAESPNRDRNLVDRCSKSWRCLMWPRSRGASEDTPRPPCPREAKLTVIVGVRPLCQPDEKSYE